MLFSVVTLPISSLLDGNRYLSHGAQPKYMTWLGSAMLINIIHDTRICRIHQLIQSPNKPLDKSGTKELTDQAPIVEHDHRSRCPAYTRLEIVPHHQVVEQEVHEHLGLGLLEPHNARDELAVEEQTPLARDGVDAH